MPMGFGPQGSVVSFEPNPVKFRSLVDHCGNLPNVTLLECGLGKSDGKFPFVTSKGTQNDSRGVMVDIRSGDSLLATGSVNAPNIVKVDVEGFEWGVLEGMKGLLGQSRLRAIGIEVHFGILKTRRRERVPLQIERVLTDSGLTYTWTDFSHLLAVRKV
jgi:FkbM family methyltransferase